MPDCVFRGALFLPILLSLAIATPAPADEVSDALQAAVDAYDAGDLKTTSQQISRASSALAALSSAKIAALLPEAPEGWTREASGDFAAGMVVLGGGSGSEMTYTDASGASFVISVIADNPMVSGLAGMFADDSTMAMMGKVIELPGASVIDQDGTLLAVIGERMMIQASGMDSATMLPVFSAIDFTALAEFDK
ncbi:MAG: hypothetical protein HC844_05990 [Tabrizicola sp.]|nr:hypothetical protein [Tabrizicola sp.]